MLLCLSDRLCGQCCSNEVDVIGIEFLFLAQRCQYEGDRAEYQSCEDFNELMPDKAYVVMTTTAEAINSDSNFELVSSVNLGSTFQMRAADFNEGVLPEKIKISLFADSSLQHVVQQLIIPNDCATGLLLNKQWGSLRIQSIEMISGRKCIAKTAGILPLSFHSFEVSSRSDGVELSWWLAGDLFTGRMELQRSDDGNYFDVIQTFSHKQIDPQYKYSYLDDSPGRVNFYRLKLFDEKGAFSYSEVKMISHGSGVDILIFPNPVTNQIYIEGQQDNASVSIYSAMGNLMQVLPANQFPLNVSLWSSGIYFLTIFDGEKQVQHKLVKR